MDRLQEIKSTTVTINGNSMTSIMHMVVPISKVYTINSIHIVPVRLAELYCRVYINGVVMASGVTSSNGTIAISQPINAAQFARIDIEVHNRDSEDIDADITINYTVDSFLGNNRYSMYMKLTQEKR